MGHSTVATMAGGTEPVAATDASLLARVAAGDAGAPLEALVERHGASVFGFGMRRLDDRGMAEELVQDTFVRLWRGAGGYDPARGSVRTFLFAIARHALGDLRRRRASRPLDTEARDPGEGSEEPPHDRLVLGLAVRDALRGLSAKHRETLELVYDEDLSQPQIAARLGIPLGTVKTRTFHALRALRAELEERGVDA